MNATEWAHIAARLAAAYPRLDLPAETIAVYLDELRTCDAVDVATAARNLIRTSKFLPSVAEILEEVADVRRLRATWERVDHPALTPNTRNGAEQEALNTEGLERAKRMLAKVGRPMPEVDA